MSNTPRTDAIWKYHAGRVTNQGYLHACTLERELAAANQAREQAEQERDVAKQDAAAIRQLMNVHNLGGWTDAVGPMKRALNAEQRAETMHQALRKLAIGKIVTDGRPYCRLCETHSLNLGIEQHVSGCLAALAPATEPVPQDHTEPYEAGPDPLDDEPGVLGAGCYESLINEPALKAGPPLQHSVYAWIGRWRDAIPAEALTALWDILGPLEAAGKDDK